MMGKSRFDEIIFDSGAMRSTAEEGSRMLSSIREDIMKLDREPFSSGIKEQGELLPGDEKEREAAVRGLLAICGGYEALLRNLEAAANVYESAMAAAEGLADF